MSVTFVTSHPIRAIPIFPPATPVTEGSDQLDEPLARTADGTPKPRPSGLGARCAWAHLGGGDHLGRPG